METLKIIAVILIFVLAFVWGSLGGINERSLDRRKCVMTYIVGSFISALMMLLMLYILN